MEATIVYLGHLGNMALGFRGCAACVHRDSWGFRYSVAHPAPITPGCRHLSGTFSGPKVPLNPKP